MREGGWKLQQDEWNGNDRWLLPYSTQTPTHVHFILSLSFDVLRIQLIPLVKGKWKKTLDLTNSHVLNGLDHWSLIFFFVPLQFASLTVEHDSFPSQSIHLSNDWDNWERPIYGENERTNRVSLFSSLSFSNRFSYHDGLRSF